VEGFGLEHNAAGYERCCQALPKLESDAQDDREILSWMQNKSASGTPRSTFPAFKLRAFALIPENYFRIISFTFLPAGISGSM
jgi:hypothetical protein